MVARRARGAAGGADVRRVRRPDASAAAASAAAASAVTTAAQGALHVRRHAAALCGRLRLGPAGRRHGCAHNHQRMGRRAAAGRVCVRQRDAGVRRRCSADARAVRWRGGGCRRRCPSWIRPCAAGQRFHDFCWGARVLWLHVRRRNVRDVRRRVRSLRLCGAERLCLPGARRLWRVRGCSIRQV